MRKANSCFFLLITPPSFGWKWKKLYRAVFEYRREDYRFNRKPINQKHPSITGQKKSPENEVECTSKHKEREARCIEISLFKCPSSSRFFFITYQRIY